MSEIHLTPEQSYDGRSKQPGHIWGMSEYIVSIGWWTLLSDF